MFMSKYTPVIGLEVHVELNTKTKMFCRCSADYWSKEPNTHTCPVCLGLPGALPYANQEALEKCIMIGLALNCKIIKVSRFERKNYFYPDLPKGYQISQHRWPLCVSGKWDLSSGKTIKINRVHMEEDTAKLMYQFRNPKSQILNSNTDGTGIDFNRSGVALVEIVTEPDFDNAEDVVDFAKQLQKIVRDIGVSNADMERGDLRLEANVSVCGVAQVTSNTLPDYRVELKNINSFRFMKQAIQYEIQRQIKIKDEGGKLAQETRGWDENKQVTYSQREKEEAHDYRYFPDPDLPELQFTDKDIDKLKGSMPELSSEKALRLSKAYGVPLSSTTTIVNQGAADYFTKASDIAKSGGISAIDIANVIINKRVDIDKISPEQLPQHIKFQEQTTLSNDDLKKAVGQVIIDNPKVAEDFKKGKTNALQFLIGQVMKNTRGQAFPENAKKMLEEKLK